MRHNRDSKDITKRQNLLTNHSTSRNVQRDEDEEEAVDLKIVTIASWNVSNPVTSITMLFYQVKRTIYNFKKWMVTFLTNNFKEWNAKITSISLPLIRRMVC